MASVDTPAAEPITAERGANVVTYALLATVAVIATIFAFSSNALPNHWYGVFKTVHVIFAVAWIGGGVLLTILGLRAQREKDPVVIVTVARQAAFAGEKIFAPAGLVVLLMGISMM